MTNQVMSNPDASAGPYVGNDKKPIGGNILAHASTTRYCLYLMVPKFRHSHSVMTEYNSRREGRIRGRQRSMIHLACPSRRPCSRSCRAVSVTQKKKRDRSPAVFHVYRRLALDRFILSEIGLHEASVFTTQCTLLLQRLRSSLYFSVRMTLRIRLLNVMVGMRLVSSTKPMI
ncbi:Rad51-domain-containing protein [Trametopsis cervina]|nr:Rad51-domain-containing protein [Trametopsis cervina]